MEDVKETMDYLMKAEELGCDILSLKEQILELNRRASETREAASEMKRCEDQSHAYMFEGALLVRNAREDILTRLTERHRELQAEIKARGEEMRAKVFALQDLELQAPFAGRGLVPLERRELDALAQVWGAQS